MIRILDKHFVPYIGEEELATRINELATQINIDFKDKNPLFIGILNGSFIFASDLYKQITIPSTISFIKLASYKGTTSSGTVITAIGLEENIHDRNVIIIEDIVDTGNTMFHFLESLSAFNPSSVAICTLLQKPEALLKPLEVQYVGFKIPNKFVVGYGLDYDGYGRNSKMIFQIKE
ncbi:MAG: hypoxanthine phosphoribosyltransferase [Bacteroidetes bacterium OLB11]|nr:MAG: hypoxanthine phosphoribosyltransferase [Bacteroidetes bacterium OLB11]